MVTLLDSISIIIMSLIPAIIYSFIIWASMPVGSVNLRKGLSFIIPGLFSVFIVQVLHILNPMFFLPMISGSEIDMLFFQAFFQVGMIEEFSKWVVLYIAIRAMKAHSDNPLSIMFYGGMIAAGFSVIENVFYGAQINSAPLSFQRGFSATIAHMTCGLIMGYWVAKAYSANVKRRTWMSMFLNAFPKIRVATFTFLGVFCASFMHGLYDFNIFINTPASMPLMYVILYIALLVCYVAAKDLEKNYE